MSQFDPKFMDTSYGTPQHQRNRAESLTYMASIGYDEAYQKAAKSALRTAYDFQVNVIIVRDPSATESRFYPYRLVRQDKIVQENGFGNHDVATIDGHIIH